VMSKEFLGPTLRIARMDKERFLSAWSKAELGKVVCTPPPKIDALQIRKHFNIFGAQLQYVLDGERLYYVKDSGEDRFDTKEKVREHLAECMRMAVNPLS